MMQNEIRLTGDGSHSLYSRHFDEQYHSTFGAIQESLHIFIRAGFETVATQQYELNILEIGTGTALNLVLTAIAANKARIKVDYTGIEAFPVDAKDVALLNYPQLLGFDKQTFLNIHRQKKGNVSEHFSYHIFTGKFPEMKFAPQSFHLVYFDAFSPEIQPEMWQEKGFQLLYKAMFMGGILTTYSCKGSVKRTLKNVGFQIEKLTGPPGKREFLRAQKPFEKT